MSNQIKIGWRPYVTQVVNAVDADATAFIAAAGITNLTQAAAISTLVNDLKTYGLWTKMKALYPMVGGSAASHKFNLKDPRDLDIAFRLTFNGGWTHSATGALPNGSNGYAETWLNENNVLTLNNEHISYYSRTNSVGNFGDMGNINTSISGNPGINLNLKWSDGNFYPRVNDNNSGISNPSSSTGLFISNRTNSTQVRAFQNGVLKLINSNSIQKVDLNIYIGATRHNFFGTAFYTNRESAFSSIGDGLTDTDAANFYTAVQKFQTTLGRQIGSPIVSDTDAQAFINAAGLTDLGQANAVNTLVVDLKAAGVWTKMKALYPFVGGTATAHKFNLKDPRDLDAAYRLVFNGGWVHSATGALPNGTTGYANTFYGAGENITIGNGYIGYYTNSTTDGFGLRVSNMSSIEFLLYQSSGLIGFQQWPYSNITYTTSYPGLNMGGRFTSGSNQGTKLYKNGTLVSTQYPSFGNIGTGRYFYLAARNTNNYGVDGFSVINFQFTFMSDTLTDSESSIFYTAVQKYQTSLGRQVGTPVLAEGQTAGLLETYSGATAAYSLRKLRNGYVGNAIRVRRSSDNSEQDIAFKADGTLDTVGLTGFVGSGNGFVTTWYDQSGNGKHAYQISASNQPRIVLGGVIDLINNKPSLKFTNGQMLVTTQNVLSTGNQPYSIYGVSYNNATADSTLFFLGADNLNVSNQYLSLQVNTNGGMTNFRHFWGTSFGWSPGLNTNNIQQYYYIGYDGSTKYSSTNNTNLTNNQVVSMNLQSPILKIGQLPQVSEYYKGYHQELILFNSNSSSTTTGIKTNINSFYSIY
jgi:hypothetical protein